MLEFAVGVTVLVQLVVTEIALLIKSSFDHTITAEGGDGVGGRDGRGSGRAGR